MEIKMVPMAGLEINYYKGHVIEWVEARGAYRVAMENRPTHVLFYTDSIPEAWAIIDGNA